MRAAFGIMTRYVVATIAAASLVATAEAEPGQFRARRDVSPTGRTYLVTKRGEHALSAVLCTRRDGAPPMTSAEATKAAGGTVDRDAEDPIVVSATVDAPPFAARVVDRPPCAVLFSSDGLLVLGKTGVVATRPLSDFLDAAESSERRVPDHEGRWDRGFWVDETRGAVAVVAPSGRIVEVSLLDGAVSRPGPEAVLGGFASASETERDFALELAATLRPRGLAVLADAIAADENAAIGPRLRAAGAAKAGGSDASYAAVFQVGMASTSPDADRRYAFDHVVPQFGKGAVALLAAASRGPFPDAGAQRAAESAWASLGADVVPTLRDMLAKSDAPQCFRYVAADSLNRIGTRDAYDALFGALANGVREAYFGATYGESLAADLADRFAAILLHGSPVDDMLVQWFKHHPTKGSRAALDAALERTATRKFERKTVVEALDALDVLEGRAHVERPDPAEAAARERREAKARAEDEARRALVPPHGDSFVAGRVVDESGRAVGGIVVAAVRRDGPPEHPYRTHGTATTDAAGGFRIDGLVDGEFTVSLDADRFRDCTPGGTQGVFVEHAKAGTTDVTLRFEIGATIRGRLIDERAAPLARQVVVARMIDPPQRFEFGENAMISEQVTTDISGVFWFIRLRPGHYRLTTPAQGPGGKYLVATGGDDLATGTDGATLVAHEGASIAGVVVDERGEPIADALVQVGGAATHEPRGAKTQADGTFEVSGLVPGGRYGVGAVLWVPRDDVDARGGKDDVVAGARDVRIVIDTGKRISFRFVADDGRPISVDQVRVVRVANGQEARPARSRDGFVVRGVADGAWRVEVVVRGAARAAQWTSCGEIDAGREGVALVVPK